MIVNFYIKQTFHSKNSRNFDVMKKLLILLCLTISSSSFAQNVEFFFDFSTYQLPEGESYVESYLSIPARSIELVPQTDGTYSGSVAVTITFSQNDTVRQFDKYNLNSPAFTTTNVTDKQLLDLKRFVLPSGNYLMELTIGDNNDTTNLTQTYSENINIPVFSTELLSQSQISLLESFEESEVESPFTKSGLEMRPLVFPVYATDSAVLSFYNEIYPVDFSEEGGFLLTYFIARKGKNLVVKNKKRYKKMSPEKVNVLLGSLDVSDLPSGNYDLVVEVRNQSNELLTTKRKTFQRFNRSAKKVVLNPDDLENIPIENTFVSGLLDEEIFLCSGSLMPLVDEQQADLIYKYLEAKDVLFLKKYLYNFWSVNAPLDTENNFAKFVQLANTVEKKFATGNKKRGYETDMGYVYLKYGKPNDITSQGKFDPGALPYEIWQYFAIEQTGQRNANFVFYAADYSSTDYILLHSDVRGEIQEPRWKKVIYRKVGEDDFNFDDTDVNNSFGSGSSDF